MTTVDVYCIVKAKLKVKHAGDAEEALMGMSKTGYAAASTGPKDASCQYVENVYTELDIQGKLDGLFIKNVDWWSQAPKF